MASPISDNSDYAEKRFLDYLCSIPAYKACQILGLQGPDLDFPSFAAAMVAGIPLQYFNQPQPIVDGPHFEVRDGSLTLVTKSNSNSKMTWPTQIASSPSAAPFHVAPPATRPASRLRSLNSFMLFRSFVAPLFYGVTQKQKSTLISTIWAEEPLKAQWTVMAKAYTFLRDHFELGAISLSDFTATVAPMFGIPSANTYITILGWTIMSWTLEDGQKGFDVTQSWDPDLADLNLQPVSVENIVDHYQELKKLVTKDGSVWPLPQQGYSALALNSNCSVDTRQELPDPYGWLFNNRGERQDGPIEDLHLMDVYDNPGPDMDPFRDLVVIPPTDVLVNPNFDLELADELDKLFSNVEFSSLDAQGFLNM